jgi:hypothetical protein
LAQQQQLNRQNPLNAPRLLLDLADGPLTDQLEVTLTYIDGLPPELKTALLENIERENLDDLRLVLSGLKKLRENVLPSEPELGLICHPHWAFDDLPRGLLAAVESGTTLDREQFVATNIVKPLTEISESFLPGPALGIVQWWFEKLQDDPDGPFSDPTPAVP